jgi:O-antigen/teichoic acid export membrane protein
VALIRSDGGIGQALHGLRGRGLGHFAGALGVRGLEVLGKFGLYFIAARQLGGYDSGLLFFCLTWVNLASAAARMGLERALTRHLAAELAIGQGRAARRTLLAGMAWCSVGGLAWAVLTFVLAGPVAVHVFGQPDLAAPLRLSALVLLPQTVVIVLGNALVGLKRGALGQLVHSALPPVLVLGAIMGGVVRLDAVILSYAAAYGVTGLLGLALLRLDWRAMVDTPLPPGVTPLALPTLRRSAVPFLAVELVQLALTSLPLLLLGAFAGPVEVGAFSVASRMSILAWMVPISLGAIAAPRFAEHFRRQEYTVLAAVNRLSSRVALLCTLPVVIALLVAPRALLGLIGPNFEIGAPWLTILALGQLVNCVWPLQDVMLGMTGHGKALRLMSFAQLGLGVVLGVALIPYFGGLGAAITQSACTALGAVGTTLAARRLVPRADPPLGSRARLAGGGE